LGGEPWWHLIVRAPDGSYRAARFSAIYQSLQRTAGAEDFNVSTLNLTAVPDVEQDAIETTTAQALARKNLARVVVVTAAGAPVGILVEGVRRGAGLLASAVSIGELGGKHVKLKDYGSILLGPVKKRAS
jgi:hypothetical protein